MASDLDNVSDRELLLGILHELHSIRGLLAQSNTDTLPSITVEDVAKAAKPKITTKSYEGRPLSYTAVDEHLAIHEYARRKASAEADEAQMGQWKATLDTLQGQRERWKEIQKV